MTIRDIIKNIRGDDYGPMNYKSYEDAEQAINAYILNQIIGTDDTEVRGTTQDQTNPKYWTKRTKVRNELREEQRSRL